MAELRQTQTSLLKTVNRLTRGGERTTTLPRVAAAREITLATARTNILRLAKYGVVRYKSLGQGAAGEVYLTAAGRKQAS